MMTFGNIDGSGRQVTMFLHPATDTLPKGVMIVAGCFYGSLDEFCTKATAEEKHDYVTLIRFAAAMVETPATNVVS